MTRSIRAWRLDGHRCLTGSHRRSCVNLPAMHIDPLDREVLGWVVPALPLYGEDPERADFD